jgi:hypothetical protein
MMMVKYLRENSIKRMKLRSMVTCGNLKKMVHMINFHLIKVKMVPSNIYFYAMKNLFEYNYHYNFICS